MQTEEAAAESGGARPPVARRGAHTIRWVMLGLGGGLVLVLAVLASRLGKDATYVPTPLIGKAAPAFTFTRFDGTTVTNADLAGKPYVVNFWASWCGPCRTETPLLERWHKKIEKRGGTVVGVDVLDVVSDAQKFVDEYGVTYPQLRDGPGEHLDEFGVVGYPESVVLDREGRIAATARGPVTDRFFQEEVVPLLDEGARQ
jgi:cytochrome c biogenesis protein CcmG/thiol:disulfide interchange protein DsbE